MFRYSMVKSVYRMTIGAALLVAATAAPGWSQPAKVAVIDVELVVRSSNRGKEATAGLDQLRNDKEKALSAIADQIKGLQGRMNEGRLSLAEEKLAELQKQYEDLAIRFRREEDDAKTALQAKQQEVLTKIESQVMPIINAIGKQGGYTLIFNKFGSGLVYADDATDITQQVIERFDSVEPGS